MRGQNLKCSACVRKRTIALNYKWLYCFLQMSNFIRIFSRRDMSIYGWVSSRVHFMVVWKISFNPLSDLEHEHCNVQQPPDLAAAYFPCLYTQTCYIISRTEILRRTLCLWKNLENLKNKKTEAVGGRNHLISQEETENTFINILSCERTILLQSCLQYWILMIGACLS